MIVENGTRMCVLFPAPNFRFPSCRINGMHDVVIIGGGIIGLSIAREAAARGHSVLLLDRGAPGEAATWAAAGMLAPQSEADRAGHFFHLSSVSLRMYRAWSDHLREQTGVDPEYVQSGLLVIASSDDEMRALIERFEWQRSANL